MPENSLSINETFEKLDSILKDMENPELSLEDSFEKYNEGLKLIRQCNNSIEKIEQQLTILEEN